MINYAFMEEQISDAEVDDVADVTPDEEEIDPQIETNEIAEVDAEMRAIYNQQVSALYLLSQHTRAKLVLQRYGDSDILREMLGTTLDRSVVSTESFVEGLEGIASRIIGTIWNSITAGVRKIFPILSAFAAIIGTTRWNLNRLAALYGDLEIYSEDVMYNNICVLDPPDERARKMQAIRDCAAAVPDALAALRDLSATETPRSVLTAMDSMSKINYVTIGPDNAIDWGGILKKLQKHWSSSEFTSLAAAGYGDNWDAFRVNFTNEIRELVDASDQLAQSDTLREVKDIAAQKEFDTPALSEDTDDTTARAIVAKANACTGVILGGYRMWAWYAWWNIISVGFRLDADLAKASGIDTGAMRLIMTALRALGRVLKSFVS